MDSNQLPYWLAAFHLPKIASRKWLQWLEQFSDMQNFIQASQQDLLAVGIPLKYVETLQHPDWDAVEKDLKWAEQPNHHIITLADDDYPALLKEIPDPPPVLFIRGNKSALKQVQIGMVGSRHATPTGLKNAEQFAHHLARAGFAITSGLALGIDGASHRGALAAKGVTVGVMGTGMQHIYPPSHVPLAEEIVSSAGALVSEFPLNTLPHPGNFPRRNRIIGGLSVGVLVVEAALKSGSLITARHALEQGREVFAIPGSIHNLLARGCHHLIRQGAKLVETAADILEEIGALIPTNLYREIETSSAHSAKLSAENRKILAQIEYEITPIDVVLLRSGLTAGIVSSILLTLELNGCIQSVPGGYIRTVQNQ